MAEPTVYVLRVLAQGLNLWGLELKMLLVEGGQLFKARRNRSIEIALFACPEGLTSCFNTVHFAPQLQLDNCVVVYGFYSVQIQQHQQLVLGSSHVAPYCIPAARRTSLSAFMGFAAY